MQINLAQAAPTQAVDVDALVQEMTLAEKIGQMTQVEKNSIPLEDVTAYFIGSVLSGGGGNPQPNTPENWAKMVRAFQEAALKTRLGIPLIYGSDAVHGHSNMHGAVIFPHNVGLGATRDADLVRRIARITARELMAVNVHFNFAPAVSVPQDIRWGRTYEGFSEDTALVTELATAYMQGLQDEDPRVLASIKHYVADGGTAWGSTQRYEWIYGNWQAPGDSYKIDQGDARIDEDTLRAVHLPPYRAAIEAGAQNVMVSFSSWQGVKMHAHKYLLTDVLKGEFGFQGFVISDWMAVSQISPDYATSVITSINAGLDMVMVPYDYKGFITTLTRAVEAGDVSIERIDDAVRRILRVKAWLGMFEQPFGREDLLPEVGSPEHRQVAREAVRKSLVLLKNEHNTLPLSKDAYILVAGKGADDWDAERRLDN
jgi:beta-glucosidase